jgi:hypothetical protein
VAIKAVVVLVLGYAAWQEWNQHIISATTIAAEQAQKIDAERRKAEYEAQVQKLSTDVKTMPITTTEHDKETVCGNAALRERYGDAFGCPPN